MLTHCLFALYLFLAHPHADLRRICAPTHVPYANACILYVPCYVLISLQALCSAQVLGVLSGCVGVPRRSAFPVPCGSEGFSNQIRKPPVHPAKTSFEHARTMFEQARTTGASLWNQVRAGSDQIRAGSCQVRACIAPGSSMLGPWFEQARTTVRAGSNPVRACWHQVRACSNLGSGMLESWFEHPRTWFKLARIYARTSNLRWRLVGENNREIDVGFGSCRACRACGRAGEAKLRGSASAVMIPSKVGVGGRICGVCVACGSAAARPVPDRCPVPGRVP